MLSEEPLWVPNDLFRLGVFEGALKDPAPLVYFPPNMGNHIFERNHR